MRGPWEPGFSMDGMQSAAFGGAAAQHSEGEGKEKKEEKRMEKGRGKGGKITKHRLAWHGIAQMSA